MNKNKITIRPEGSLEAILSLGPVVRALGERNAGAEIGLVAEECFREAAGLVPGLSFFETTPPSEGVTYDFSQRAGESWGQESLDWKAYLQGCAAGAANPYHQIDLSRKAADAETIDVNFELLSPGVEESLPESVVGGNALRIALCASSLSINELQALLEGISRLETPAAVHLLGTVPDRRKSTILLSAWEERIQLVDLCGRQSFSQMAETLRLCDIAFTAPGASALLSSGYGTFTICVDEGRNPLHYPYGHGHLVIQRTDSEEFHVALGRMTTDIVGFALSGNGGNIPSLSQWQAFADERVDNFLSHLRLFATQRLESLEGNSSVTELCLRPLIFLGAEYGDMLRSIYRLVWEHSVRGRSLAAHDLEILHQDTLGQLAAELKAMEQLYELANFGRTFSEHILDSLTKADQSRAKQDAAKLQETEELIHMLAKTAASLVPLASFHEKRQRLLDEMDPIELSRQMAKLFSDMQERILLLLDLAKTLFHTTLQNESRPIVSEENPSHG